MNAADVRASVDVALSEYRAKFTEDRWQLYLSIHHERYQLLVADVLRLVEACPPAGAGGHLRILDIGPRFEVDLIHRLYPEIEVDTLGLNAGLFPLLEGEHYIEFDLNKADDAAGRPTPGPYQLIVMAEVLEHLWTAPSVVLPWLRSLLVPGGYLLLGPGEGPAERPALLEPVVICGVRMFRRKSHTQLEGRL